MMSVRRLQWARSNNIRDPVGPLSGEGITARRSHSPAHPRITPEQMSRLHK